MAQIEVLVSAPGKRPKRWKLPQDRLIDLLVPTIVERMSLPTKINWDLVSTREGKALAGDKTLAKEKIRPGTMLTLQPVRDTLLKKFLEKIYEEAEGNVQDELWDKALEKMEELHEYDPRFPDPKGLRKVAQMGLTPSAAPAAGVSWGLVLGGVALAGTLAVGAVTIVGGAGYLVYRASQEETHTHYTDPQIEHDEDEDNEGGYVQPQTGDVQVTLKWYDEVDLDLYVQDPNGDVIYHDNPRAASGGELDVDANYPCGNTTPTPLENVYWPRGGAPSGNYEVGVKYFADCTGMGSVEYQVIVRLNEEILDTYSGAISPGEEVFITAFEY